MTIRESVNKKKKIIYLIAFAGILLQVVMVATCIEDVNGFPPFYVFIGAIIYIVAMLSMMFVIKCPICKENLGLVLVSTGSPFAISKKIKYCPYCGTRMDEEKIL